MSYPKSTIHDLTLQYGYGTYRVGWWLPHEDKVLLDLYFNEGATTKALVYALRRSPDSIRGRLHRLGIRQKQPASILRGLRKAA